MAAFSPTGVRLLSALRRTRSKSSLYETPEIYFEEGEERDAFNWLKDYVQTYNAFPTPDTFKQETGIQTIITKEPVAFYQNEARRRTLWQSMLDPFGEIRDHIEAHEPDKALDLMRTMVQAANEINHRRGGLTTLSESLDQVEADYNMAKQALGLRGIPTPWEFLNAITDGWQNADVISIVARPGRGKTMVLLYMAYIAWRAGYSVLFLSMEMGVVQLARRLFGMSMGVNPNFLRRGNLSTHAEREMRRQKETLQEIATPWYWLAGRFQKTIPALRAAAYETEADIIFADASYLLKPEAKNQRFGQRREAIASVIEDIGDLARDLNRPIVQSVQFNRQAVKPKKGEEEEQQRNPIAHLSLEKIGETDVVGQVSSLVFGLEKGDTPHQDDERYMGLLKGREGEQGWMKFHYKFQPVNFDHITDHTRFRTDPQDAPEAPDLSFMDAVA